MFESAAEIDLLALDRDVAQASARLEQARARLETDPARADLLNPLDDRRHVAAQSTFRALSEKDVPHELLHRDGLLRWVHELLQARIGWDLEVAAAEARHAVDPRAPRLARDGTTLARTWTEARHALISAETETSAATALERLAELSLPVSAVYKESRERRFEIARRLGLAHPYALAIKGDVSALGALALALLDATEPLAVELRKERDRRAGTPGGAARTIHDAFARDAREGWPAHLGDRWLSEMFRALEGTPVRAARLPAALGGASFLRAASSWGFARRLAGTARSLPFTLARDPYPDDAYRFGCALASAVADRVFLRRSLGLTSRSAAAEARVLTGSLFFSARWAALRLHFALRERIDPSEHEELCHRVLGGTLPAAMVEITPMIAIASPSEPARFLGALRAHALVRELVDRFDEDWFSNPRAGAHLASISAGPIFSGEIPEPPCVAPIARAFEEALG